MESNDDLLNEKDNKNGNCLIDNKYIILDKKGSGLTSVVFKVKPLKDTNDQKIILTAKVEKILSEKKQKLIKIPLKEIFTHEINILNTINKKNSPYKSYIANIKNSGIGEVKRPNKPTTTHNYIILEYAERGCLYDYIYFPEKGFREEEYAKLLFFRILLGIKACHEAKICNRDIKLENILLDETFNPKICDWFLRN